MSRWCPSTDLEKLHAKYVLNETSGCWMWTGSLSDKGYGLLSVLRNGKSKQVRAHRLSYEAHNDTEIPHGLMVCHTCDTPACVNPQHLFLGTAQDNVDDCRIKGRMLKAIGPKHQNARFSAEIVYRIRYVDLRPASAIAGELGVSRNAIWSVRARKTWKHVA